MFINDTKSHKTWKKKQQEKEEFANKPKKKKPLNTSLKIQVTFAHHLKCYFIHLLKKPFNIHVACHTKTHKTSLTTTNKDDSTFNTSDATLLLFIYFVCFQRLKFAAKRLPALGIQFYVKKNLEKTGNPALAKHFNTQNHCNVKMFKCHQALFTENFIPRKKKK